MSQYARENPEEFERREKEWKPASWPKTLPDHADSRPASETELRSQLASALSSERRLREALQRVVGGIPEYDAVHKEFFHDHNIPPDEGPSIEYLNPADIIFGISACATAALTTPAACPDLVLVGREEWERIQPGLGRMEIRQEILLAVNLSCSCGGRRSNDPLACPACEVWHRLFGDAVQKQVTEAGLKGDYE